MAPSLGARLYEMNVSPTLSYVEQLCPAPPSVETAEKSAIEKTMHAPHNSFVGSSAFYLEQAGMVPFSSILVRGEAARVRTAALTCTCWRQEWELLSSARLELGPMINRSIHPPHGLKDYPKWKSEAFVDVLERASRQQYNVEPSVERKGFQAAVVKVVKAAHFPSDLAAEVAPRLYRFLAREAFPEEYLLAEVRATLKHARRMAPSVGWALLRTWLNSWVTSSRVGAQTSNCKFGCARGDDDNETDRLNHYVDCDAWWDSWLQVLWKECRWTWAATRWNFLVLKPPFLNDLDFQHHNKLVALTIATDSYHAVGDTILKGSRDQLPQIQAESLRRVYRVATFMKPSPALHIYLANDSSNEDPDPLLDSSASDVEC